MKLCAITSIASMFFMGCGNADSQNQPLNNELRASSAAIEQNKTKTTGIKVTFVELGSENCMPCRMMQPIISEIREQYKSQVRVVFHDVWTEQGRPYAQMFGIRLMPTQFSSTATAKSFSGTRILFKGRYCRCLEDKRRSVMFVGIFTWLSAALASSAGFALAGSFLWGVLSIVLSPCHLSSIPLIVAFIGGGSAHPPCARSCFRSFFSGILVTIAVTGLITGLMGRMMGDLGGWGNYIIAVIFFIIGLHLAGVIPPALFR